MINQNIYSSVKNQLFDKISTTKRNEMANILLHEIKNISVESILDVGTTDDNDMESSNFLLKKIKDKGKKIISISDQKIEDTIFNLKIQKSITSDFDNNEIEKFSADIVISNATIEHVGNYDNQKKMIKNVIRLSKKLFFITTPNRYHFLDFHTLLPFIHWLPKKLHRSILNLTNHKYLAKEENLNLMSLNDLKKIMNEISYKNYRIDSIKLFYIKSNLILIGKK